MVNVSDVQNGKLTLFKCAAFLFVLMLLLFLEGCAKTPVANEHSATAANANQPEEERANQPLLQKTITGDIERITLAISTARDAVRVNKWEDAISQLHNARKEVDVALTREPRFREEFEALKSAIDRAIPAVEGRGKEAEGRIAELQTRIGAIKVNTLTR